MINFALTRILASHTSIVELYIRFGRGRCVVQVIQPYTYLNSLAFSKVVFFIHIYKSLDLNIFRGLVLRSSAGS